ncbi:MAG: DUF4364 family protein [Clostridia bacterium]|nr:DUF4364 family protein [Clostridia bacterium]MBR3954046.1 DUF4364 family protein [Clostridia bacterium]
MAKEIDALTAGVRIGGLYNRSDIKVLLCYILKCVDYPTCKSSIDRFLLENELVNYYEGSNALGELVQAGHIAVTVEDGLEYYNITESGRFIARELDSHIPYSVRQLVIREAMHIALVERRKKGVKTEVVPHGSGYDVIMKIFHGEDEVFKLSFYCADSLQASMICDRFEADPAAVYTTVIDALTEDKKEENV